jgi:pSer/pThr/pTyr-binding forkhead associated (FHA) protein
MQRLSRDFNRARDFVGEKARRTGTELSRRLIEPLGLYKRFPALKERLLGEPKMVTRIFGEDWRKQMPGFDFSVGATEATNQLTIGKDGDLVVPDNYSVAQNHCTIEVEADGGLRVKNNSLNETFVIKADGNQIPLGQDHSTDLGFGDIIYLQGEGYSSLAFEVTRSMPKDESQSQGQPQLKICSDHRLSSVVRNAGYYHIRQRVDGGTQLVENRPSNPGLIADIFGGNLRQNLLDRDPRWRPLGDGEEAVILGRSAATNEAHIAIPSADSKVSRRHCAVRYDNGNLSIKDLNSTNGTYVNSERINAEEFISLNPGDLIKIGDANFLVESDGQKPYLRQIQSAEARPIEVRNNLDQIDNDFIYGLSGSAKENLIKARRLHEEVGNILYGTELPTDLQNDAASLMDRIRATSVTLEQDFSNEQAEILNALEINLQNVDQNVDFLRGLSTEINKLAGESVITETTKNFLLDIINPKLGELVPLQQQANKESLEAEFDQLFTWETPTVLDWQKFYQKIVAMRQNGKIATGPETSELLNKVTAEISSFTAQEFRDDLDTIVGGFSKNEEKLKMLSNLSEEIDGVYTTGSQFDQKGFLTEEDKNQLFEAIYSEREQILQDLFDQKLTGSVANYTLGLMRGDIPDADYEALGEMITQENIDKQKNQRLKRLDIFSGESFLIDPSLFTTQEIITAIQANSSLEQLKNIVDKLQDEKSSDQAEPGVTDIYQAAEDRIKDLES